MTHTVSTAGPMTETLNPERLRELRWRLEEAHRRRELVYPISISEALALVTIAERDAVAATRGVL